MWFHSFNLISFHTKVTARFIVNLYLVRFVTSHTAFLVITKWNDLTEIRTTHVYHSSMSHKVPKFISWTWHRNSFSVLLWKMWSSVEIHNLNPKVVTLPINGKNKDSVDDKDCKASLSGQRLDICSYHLHSDEIRIPSNCFPCLL